MNKHKMNIILATDFSEASQHAIEFALHIFEKNKEKPVHQYYLVHAHRVMVFYSDTPSIPVITSRRLEIELEVKLTKTVDALKEAGIKNIESVLEEGTVNEVIDSVAKDKDADLVVMGSRDKPYLERLTFGSNTMQVIDNLDIPVLAVPEEADLTGVNKKLVFTTDFKPLHLHRRTLMSLKQMVSCDDYTFSVLHVYDSEEDKDEHKIKDTALYRYFDDIEQEHYSIVNTNVSRGIHEFVEEHEPLMLIAIPRDHSFFHKIFHIRETEKMVYQDKLPILILN